MPVSMVHAESDAQATGHCWNEHEAWHVPGLLHVSVVMGLLSLQALPAPHATLHLLCAQAAVIVPGFTQISFVSWSPSLHSASDVQAGVKAV